MLKKFEEYMEHFLLKADTDDKEFLPPAVEILEKPPSPAGRILIWVILALFLLAILWSFIGEIDEVVVARGKVIPIGYTKVLQSEDKGIVKRILAQEGQKVRQGDLLMELDLDKMSADLKAEIAQLTEKERDRETEGQKRARAVKRLEVVESFRTSHNKPEWMILTVVPVIH